MGTLGNRPGPTGSIPGSCTKRPGRRPFLIAESCGEIAELDAQPRLAGELQVAMHVGDRYAAFTDGCCHTLH
jgi:hypothetical protein